MLELTGTLCGDELAIVGSQSFHVLILVVLLLETLHYHLRWPGGAEQSARNFSWCRNLMYEVINLRNAYLAELWCGVGSWCRKPVTIALREVTWTVRQEGGDLAEDQRHRADPNQDQVGPPGERLSLWTWL